MARSILMGFGDMEYCGIVKNGASGNVVSGHVGQPIPDLPRQSTSDAGVRPFAICPKLVQRVVSPEDVCYAHVCLRCGRAGVFVFNECVLYVIAACVPWEVPSKAPQRLRGSG